MSDESNTYTIDGLYLSQEDVDAVTKELRLLAVMQRTGMTDVPTACQKVIYWMFDKSGINVNETTQVKR